MRPYTERHDDPESGEVLRTDDDITSDASSLAEYVKKRRRVSQPPRWLLTVE